MHKHCTYSGPYLDRTVNQSLTDNAVTNTRRDKAKFFIPDIEKTSCIVTRDVACANRVDTGRSYR